MADRQDYVEGIEKLIEFIRQAQTGRVDPLVVALDGKSGVGKSTIAAAIGGRLKAETIPLDDFFSATITDQEWDSFSIQERRARVFQWQRVIEECLEPLRAGLTARWRSFDFESGPQRDGTYGIESREKKTTPADIVLIDGVYSSAPELEEYVHVSILVKVPKHKRISRLRERDGVEFSESWHKRWEAVEDFYFAELRRAGYFDVVMYG